MKKIRILIADDHAIVRAGLSAVLGFEDDMEIVGEAEDGRQAVEAARTLHPDVVIMDLSMPTLDGAAATAAILREQPGARILILTTYGTSADVTRAVKSGAAGAVSKTLPNEELTAAIRSVAMGEGAFSPDVRRMLADAGRNADFTQRQIDILRSLACGLTNQDIAAQFGITVSGIKQHLAAIFAKLGTANRTEAVAEAIRRHLIDH